MEKKDAPFLVLLAALNEEEGIGPTIRELKHFLDNSTLLVIDGKSVDRTMEIAKNLDVNISAQLGKGKGDAIAHGLRIADFSGKYVVMIDADFSYPAEFIPKMIRILDNNPDVGMVCGNRFNRKFRRAGMKSLYFIGNRILALVHNLVNDNYLVDPLSGLRVIRWDILKDWRPKSSGFDIEVELNHHVEQQGYEISEIPIGLRSRVGKKKLKIIDGLSIFKRIIFMNIG